MKNAAAGEKVMISMGPRFGGRVPTKPIKPFVQARYKSVKDQLEGKPIGQTISPGAGRSR